MGPLLHEVVRQHKGTAKRRHKTSPGMKRMAGIVMWPRIGVCEMSVSKMKPAPHVRYKFSTGAASPPVGTEAGPAGARFDGLERPDGMTV